jgi:hypothetical protein
MTFPININIPAAKNTPAQDQPEMQKNYANIAGFLAVDHTAAGSINAGTHTHVTFPTNVVPSKDPITEKYTPVLFTNNQDGNQPTPNTLPGNELFFFSGSVLESLQQYIVSSNGSTMLFGGVIFKWGNLTIPPATTSTTITFSSPYPNNCFCVLLTASNARGAVLTSTTFVSSVSATNFILTSGTNSQPATFYYLAIGN